MTAALTANDVLDDVRIKGVCRISPEQVWRLFAPTQISEWKLTGTPLKFREFLKRNAFDFLHHDRDILVWGKR
jgi:hypothetical protein